LRIGHEELPFKRFAPDAAWDYRMTGAFFLFESFKEDVCADRVPVAAYAATVRRTVIDFAAKLVHAGGQDHPQSDRGNLESPPIRGFAATARVSIIVHLNYGAYPSAKNFIQNSSWERCARTCMLGYTY
jgi:hypothetical protein